MLGRRSTDHRDEAGASLPIRGRAPARSCGAGLPLWPSVARIEGTAGPRQPRHHSKPWAAEGVRRQVSWWGFCTIRSLTTACRRRVVALMVQFPPFGGGVIGKQAAPGPARALWPFRRASHLWRWGFCSIRSLASACRRRVAALMVQFPPFGGGEVAVRCGVVAVRCGVAAVRCGVAAVRCGVAPTAHTTSMKNADNGLPRARRSALWIQRCLASCVARTRTRYLARKPAIACLGGSALGRNSG